MNNETLEAGEQYDPKSLGVTLLAIIIVVIVGASILISCSIARLRMKQANRVYSIPDV